MRVAIVVPRYGTEIGAGAETQARGMAEACRGRGWTVEVWTTCASNHYTWQNDLPVGMDWANGVALRRFPITSWHPHRWAALNVKLAALGTLSPGERYAWLHHAAHSAPLYRHVAQHASEFDVLVLLPYAIPLVHYAAWAAPPAAQTVLLPCLHHEAYAYLEPVRLLLDSVWGLFFNSPEEAELADKLITRPRPRMAVIGEGLMAAGDPPPPAQSVTPDLLYVGRLEEGKNLSTLYRYVQRYNDEEGELRLVVMGKGPVKPPDHPAFDYRGFVSDVEKSVACASALALCQPSLNESFSLTVMESWLAGRPVLVHADCPVTVGHVRRSQGGLWFADYEEFVQAVDWLRDQPRLAAQMGCNGREYVRQNYSWQAVMDRFEEHILAWRPAPDTAAVGAEESAT